MEAKRQCISDLLDTQMSVPKIMEVKGCSWALVKRLTDKGKCLLLLMKLGNGGYNRI
jgi:hypothetical protein